MLPISNGVLAGGWLMFHRAMLRLNANRKCKCEDGVSRSLTEVHASKKIVVQY